VLECWSAGVQLLALLWDRYDRCGALHYIEAVTGGRYVTLRPLLEAVTLYWRPLRYWRPLSYICITWLHFLYISTWILVLHLAAWAACPA
jgi:hypothetical protein